MDKLAGGAALVLGHVLQVDGLLQEDLPLDTGPVVPLNGVDYLDREEHSKPRVTGGVGGCSRDRCLTARARKLKYELSSNPLLGTKTLSGLSKTSRPSRLMQAAKQAGQDALDFIIPHGRHLHTPVYEASPGSSRWGKCSACHQSPHSRPCSVPSSLDSPPDT